MSASTAHDYSHTALFYAGTDDFVRKLTPFLQDGVAAGEPALVALGADKMDRLRAELGEDARDIAYADMAEVGGNPARIIPAWEEFVSAHPGRRLRGIGEPIHPGRAGAELVECQHHERLLNIALDGADLRLVCPYDTETLPPDVIAEARHSHPLLVDSGAEGKSSQYAGADGVGAFHAAPLEEPGAEPEVLDFNIGSLRAVRGVITRQAGRCGMSGERSMELVQAVSELAANSIRHAGGRGTLRVWHEDGTVICEVSDGGRIDDLLVGRRRPARDQIGGWGLWLANQLCDLLQIRSLPDGTVVRSHMRLTPRTATAG